MDTKEPVITKLDFDFAACGHSLCIVNTGGSHADGQEQCQHQQHNFENAVFLHVVVSFSNGFMIHT